jgi:hypothetical protein
MRIAGRALLALLILAVLWVAVPPAWRAGWSFYTAIRQPSAVAADAQGATTYVVARDRPLEFRLSGHADLVRLRVHALLPDADGPASAPAADYALRIEVEDTNGNLLRDYVHHVRGSIGRYLDADTGELFALNLVDEPGYAVAGINLIPLDLSAWPSAEVVRVSLAEADARIAEVGLRLYEPEAIPEHSIERFWQRLSEQQRMRLAEGNVYPHNLLTEGERAAVLSQRWRPVGPAGVQDQDYRVRSLFAREGRSGAYISSALPMAALRVDADHPVSLPVLEPGYYFIRTNLATTQPQGDVAPAQLRVEISDAGAAEVVLMTVPATTVARAISLRRGTLRLVADKPVQVVLLRNPAGGRRSSAPSVETRVFRLPAGGALNYAGMADAESAALRFDFRRRFDRIPSVDSAGLALRYEYRDAAGALVGGGTFNLPASAPAIDLRSDDPAVLLSPAATLTLDVPRGIAKVMLSGPPNAAEVYVAAYSRLPIAAGAAERDEWYGLAPSGWPELMADESSLTIQPSDIDFAHAGPTDAE